MTCTETPIARAFHDWRSLAARFADPSADAEALAQRLHQIEDAALAMQPETPLCVWQLAVMVLSDGGVDPDDGTTAGRFLARAAREAGFA